MVEIGYKDVPIKNLSEDEFDIGLYVKSLSKFILNCQTPMTVAIQGDWGSGKSSFMKMVRSEIRNSTICIWIDTWQFSQFQMLGYLPIIFLHQILNEISTEKKGGFFAAIGNFFSTCTKDLALIAVDHTLGGSMAGKLDAKLSPEAVTNAIEEIKNLKTKASAAIEGDYIRVKSKQIDELQKIMAHIKSLEWDAPLVFENFR